MDELEFLRERTLFLVSERDRLSLALNTTSRACRDLEGRSSGVRGHDLTRISAKRLESIIHRLQLLLARMRGEANQPGKIG